MSYIYVECDLHKTSLDSGMKEFLANFLLLFKRIFAKIKNYFCQGLEWGLSGLSCIFQQI
jgi:hypothetical protein